MDGCREAWGVWGVVGRNGAGCVWVRGHNIIVDALHGRM